MTRPIAQYSPNGMHLLIGTQHKLFNRQTDLISHGNVSASTMFSNYVRGKLNLECNGRVNPPGHLRDFDLHPFIEGLHIPSHVLNKVNELTDNNDDAVILYCFFHRIPGSGYPRQRVIHGWVITTPGKDCNHPNESKLLAKFYGNNTRKSINVIETCIPHVIGD